MSSYYHMGCLYIYASCPITIPDYYISLFVSIMEHEFSMVMNIPYLPLDKNDPSNQDG